MNDKTPQNIYDQLIDDLLDQKIPHADSTMKKRAIAMASDEFDKTFSKNSQTAHQGNSQPARPIDNRNTAGNTSSRNQAGMLSGLIQSIRSFFMNTNNNPFAYKAFGTAAVAFLAVSVVFMMPSTQTTTRVEELAGVIAQPIDNNIETRIEPIANDIRGDQFANTAVEKIAAVKPALLPESKENEAEVDFDRNLSSPLAKDEEAASSEGSAIANKQKNDAGASDLFDAQSAAQSAPVKARGRRLAESAVAPVSTSFVRQQEIVANQPRIDDREEYAEYQSNSVKLVVDEPVSTFSIDVDTASYSLVRNQLNGGFLPDPQAVRVEEFINYFDYNYPVPRSTAQPFEPTVSVFDSPWNEEKKLVHIGIKGYDIDASEQPDSNLVFLLDVSGSMNSANKLPLVKQSINLLLDTLKPTDTVSIAVYAGAAGVVLEPTKVQEKSKIVAALQKLSAGGSTAGGAGIQLAYQLAEQNFNKDAVNRIILATDGDFNVGQSSNEDLKTLVERKRSNGVFLSVLGFGRNNYQDDMMQTLAQNGNGVAAYIDSLSEAKKVLVDEATSTLFPIAKDVKIQVEFNPATVSEYRLVGYETRALNREDFNNDKVDAGDIGAGHTVTAIYEITPADATNQSIDEPRYAQNRAAINDPSSDNEESASDEYGFLKMRYKLPDSDTSKLIETPIKATSVAPNGEVQFSVAVAGFAQLLSNSENIGDFSYNMAIDIANEHKGADPFGYRSEFIQLARMAQIAKP